MKKGFTLIELLAVIVILAIIAVIAIPVITNAITEAKKGAAESSALGYIDAIEKQAMVNNLKETNNIKDQEDVDILDFNDDYDIKIKGKLPTAGEITIEKGKVKETTVCIGGYIVEYINGNATVGAKCTNKISTCEFYEEGQVVYENGTPGEKTFSPKCKGNYKIELWGAQGGGKNNSKGIDFAGGYGAYTTGSLRLRKDNVLYINIGGTTTNATGGYNGGGTGGSTFDDGGYNVQYTYGGGGATHIALESGLLTTFNSKQDKLLMVSGGGGGLFASFIGGAVTASDGGSGGGKIAGNGTRGVRSISSNFTFYDTALGMGGTQEQGGSPSNANVTAGTFGQGGSGSGASCGGGGGYYGGGAGNSSGAGGGSGYIGYTKLKNKKMIMYTTDNAYVSNDENTKTEITTNVSETATSNYAKKGNGYARITFIG